MESENKGKESMKEFEWLGVLFTIFAYAMIVSGHYSIGFQVGLMGNVCLIAYFSEIKSLPSLLLQTFFVCANIFGILNLGI